MFRYRLTYLAVLFAAFLYCVFDSGYLSFFALAAVLLLPILSIAFLFAAMGKIFVNVRVENSYVNRGEESVFHITLANRSFFPVSMARMRLRFENLLMGETREETVFLPVGFRSEQSVRYRLRSRCCGRIAAELTVVNCYDIMALVSKKRKTGQSAIVFVTPQTQAFSLTADTAAARPGKENSGFSDAKPGSDPSEVFDIRPFRETDLLRSIHWKLSMKQGTLIAKEFSLPADVSVSLILELLADDADTLDTVIETLFSLSYMLLYERKSHRVEWYDAPAGQLREIHIQTEDDLAAMTCAVLSSKRYKDNPYSLVCRNGESGFDSDSPFAVYITGRLTDGLMEFCCRAGAVKTTVIRCGQLEENERELKDRLSKQGARILEVPPGKTEESLSGLEL